MKNILILIFVAIVIFLSVLLIRKLINTNSETDPEIPTTENTTPVNSSANSSFTYPTNSVDQNKTRETYTATKTGTQVYMKTEYWSSVLYGKVKVVTTNGSSYYDEPGVKNKTHYTAGWYTFYSVEKDDVEIEIWQ